MEILDHGFINIVDVLGSDLTVVNAARVSFGKRKNKIDESDLKLIKYLKDNKHYSPFRHIMVTFHLKAPEFVLRQLYKHVVGIEATSSHPTKDHAWNEISGRYTQVDEERYSPKIWRRQSTDNKQASAGVLENEETEKANELFNSAMEHLNDVYGQLLSLGVAREQARIILPLNIYSEVYWTASFQAIANFIELRDHDHAQLEIREYAWALKELMLMAFPNVSRIWFT